MNVPFQIRRSLLLRYYVAKQMQHDAQSIICEFFDKRADWDNTITQRKKRKEQYPHNRRLWNSSRPEWDDRMEIWQNRLNAATEEVQAIQEFLGATDTEIEEGLAALPKVL
jgi:hypothetical protein